MSNWKGYERKVAKYFGTNRTPLSGINSRHDTHSDTLHPSLYIEVKSVSTPNSSNGWIWRWLKKINYPKTWEAVRVGGTYMFHSSVLCANVYAVNHHYDWPKPGLKLFVETCALASKERKLPLLALCVKGKHGFWIIGFADAILEAQKVRESVATK
jgi:hypothetical protein